jgi:hypothetical protein
VKKEAEKPKGPQQKRKNIWDSSDEDVNEEKVFFNNHLL